MTKEVKISEIQVIPVRRIGGVGKRQAIVSELGLGNLWARLEANSKTKLCSFMKLNDKNKPHKNRDAEKKPNEVAAEGLAEIFITLIEFQRNKNKNGNKY